MLAYYNKNLDTIYGGDNDSDGYYFNYNNSGTLLVYSIKRFPIESILKGSGTLEDPYQISTVADFNNAAINLTTERTNAYYSIMNDIDFSGKKVYIFGIESVPFKGTFEGNGYTLKNIKIESTTSYVGIIGYNIGTIRGFNVENISAKGNYSVGGVAGYNDGKISSVSVTGVITGKNNIGGIVGYNNSSGSVRNVLSRNVIVNGADSVGGITGYDYGGKPSGVVERSTITGNTSVACPLGKKYYNGTKEVYCSSDTTINGVNVTGSNVIDLTKVTDFNATYKTYLDTESDSDSDGYYFIYDSNKKSMILKKA